MTSEELKKIVHYDPETGVFTWVVPRYKAGRLVKVAGSYTTRRYRMICIGGRNYREHRLAWLYMTGDWPQNLIDHRNGVHDDNRFLNLREATSVENGQNYALPAHNKSGYLGVHFRKDIGKWRAKIKLNRKIINLGLFKTAEEASAAYLAAKAAMHPFQPVPRGMESDND
jgi:hypothetical protein